MQKKYSGNIRRLVLSLSLLAIPLLAQGQSPNPSRGLWIGEVVLTKVNEVTVPINAANVAIAPNPTNTTPAKDFANIRLIVHVDANGQATLLNSVAVVDISRTNISATSGTSITNIPEGGLISAGNDSNVVLLTDETLYSSYPVPALRVASVAFDFSDLSAVTAAKAVEAKANAAARAASDAANASSAGDSLTTVSNQVRSAAFVAASATAAPGANLTVMTNVVNSIIAATVEELSRARTRPTTPVANRLKIEQAASDTAALALSAQVRTIGAAPVKKVDLSGSLSAGGTVNGTFLLGEDHPTNPFRHKYNPDHQHGFDITRKLTLLVNSSAGTNSFERGGYGVDRLAGVYKEEVFGLHKPLGTARDIGLRTEGIFTLNRITLKDVLNQ